MNFIRGILSNMARMEFDAIFIRNQDGTLEPRQVVRIGGVTMGPGVKFGGGVSFGGIDLTKFLGRAFEVQTDNGILVITGIYGQ